MAAKLSLGAVVGIAVGCVVVLIGIGVLIVLLTTQRTRRRNTKDLQDVVMRRGKLSVKRPVKGTRFDHSDSYDVEDTYPPRRSNESHRADAFVFGAEDLAVRDNTRESYDRRYSSLYNPNPGTTETHRVGGFGEVAMISNGGSRTSGNSQTSRDSELVSSHMYLLPDTSDHPRGLANRPPLPLPNGPRFVYVQRPESFLSRTQPPYSYTEDRADSFHSSRAVDLGAQPDKAWMLSSLERERFTQRY